MSTTINGLTVYATSTRGTAEGYIRVAAVNAQDISDFDTAETAGASAAGTQTVDYDGTLVGGTDAGLVTATYTASINLDGTDYPISIGVTTADTVTTVVGLINADLPGTELAISGGNLVVTSPTTGLASYVVISDVDIFSGMTGFAGTLAAVDGGLEGQLGALTLTNGANGWSAYGHAEESYDPATDETKVVENVTDSSTGTANNALVDVGGSFTQATLNDNFATLAAKIDALQNIVEKSVLHK